MEYFKSKMPFYRLKVCMQSDRFFKANSWISSAVRGALGNNLIEMLCENPSKDCINCNNLDCSAKILYGTASPEDSSQQFNPYVVYCPNHNNDTNIIEFYITLFGNGINTIKDVFKVLSNGLNIKGNQFTLTSIIDDFSNIPIFDGFLWVIPQPQYPNFYVDENITRLILKFNSPFNSKQLDKTMNFDYLVRCAMRRTSTILKSCDVECTTNYSNLIELSKNVKLTSANIHLISNKRHSNRTNLDMSIKGYVGSLSFMGDITPFMPFFRFCELVGIGKLCVMGFGQIECIC